MQILDHLEIPVTRFTHLFETDSSYFVLGDRYYSVRDLGAKDSSDPPDERKLLEVYQLFDIRNPPRNSSTGSLLNPWGLCAEILEQRVDLQQMCKYDK